MAVPRIGAHPRGMDEREGFTLIEMVVVLAMLGILLGIAAPHGLRWRDAAAASSARDEIAATLARTRVAAVAHGGAALWIDGAAARMWITAADGDRVTPAVDLAGRYGVSIESGAAVPVELRFDGLGLGRLTSRTLRVRRGGATAGLTVSAYGRYRRW